jgi:hypothetical protein
MDIKDTGLQNVDWIQPADSSVQFCALPNAVKKVLRP